jgi:hypothetical protein
MERRFDPTKTPKPKARAESSLSTTLQSSVATAGPSVNEYPGVADGKFSWSPVANTGNSQGSSAMIHYAQQGPNLPGASVGQGNNFKFAAGDFQGFGGYTAEGNANKEFANTNKENNELVDRGIC